jgi:hypothetical protein
MQVTTFPSHDLVFRRAVEHVLRADRDLDPLDVETTLRLIYPRVALVARQISGDQDRFYAYRDGRIVPEADEDWWTLPDTARVTVSAETGRLKSVTDACADLSLDSRSRLEDIHFTDLLLPSARDLGRTLFEAVARGGEVRSQAVVQGRDGSPLAIEFRAVRNGDEVEVAYRPLPAV